MVEGKRRYHTKALAAQGVVGRRRRVPARPSIRWPRPASSALLVQAPAPFKHDTAGLDHLAWLTRRLRDYRSPLSCGTSRGATTSRRRCKCSTRRGPPGSRSRSRSRLSNRAELLPTSMATTIASSRPERQGVVEPNRPTATTTCTQPRSSIRSSDRQAVKVLVKNMYLYTNNHFEGRAAATRSCCATSWGCRTPAATRRLRRALPRPRRHRRDSLGDGKAGLFEDAARATAPRRAQRRE